MKKVVVGSVLAIVLGANVENATSDAKTWKLGANDKNSKAKNAADFGSAYKGEFSRTAAAVAQCVRVLSDASDNTALSKTVVTAAAKASTELKALFEWFEGVSEDLKEDKLMSTAKKAVEKSWPLFESNVIQLFADQAAFEGGLSQAVADASANVLLELINIHPRFADQRVQYLQTLIERWITLVTKIKNNLSQFVEANRSNPALAEAVADAERLIGLLDYYIGLANNAQQRISALGSGG
ncbi:MAG: hypothetical protein LBF54_03675 [Holosporaceae bacterium]|jgi:hypothetical protein|nr:hypothetical protein [Holosporaceae bacterium]